LLLKLFRMPERKELSMIRKSAARSLAIIFVWSIVAASCTGARAEKKEQAEIEAALRATLQGSGRPAYVTADAEGTRLWKLTRAFYESRQFAPAWIEDAEPRAQMRDLIEALWAADHEGLDPQLYNVALLDQRRQQASKGFLTNKGFEPTEAGELDAGLTYLYLKYSSDLADGLSDLAHADPKWKIRPEKFDPRAALEEALAKNEVAKSLRDLAPASVHYKALRQALHDHRAQAAKGGWPQVPAAKLKPGQSSPVVGALAARLAASGDYKGSIPPGSEAGEAAEYGADLVEAVKRFQRRHGLPDDGVVNAAVVAEMNVPIEERIARIQLNLERWRWLPRQLGDRHILVNIPEYRLEVWENDSVPVTMRTVVGKQDTPTPIFNDEMTHIVFSPYWNVPPSIAEGETLPSVLKDPGFLERQNMEVLDASGKPVDPASMDLDDPKKYRFRQRPGSQNSLGLVKFMFPNQFDVYLHDTPVDSLFGRASRSFSHGCVRLEQPMALARYVLRDQPEWTEERITEAMHAGEEKHLKLKQPIPVYLGYWTARVSADGIVQFRKDIYNIDARQKSLLAERLSRMRKAVAMASTSAPAR
jgi:murein L,D-transpeptidase YcbB/YkuD